MIVVLQPLSFFLLVSIFYRFRRQRIDTWSQFELWFPFLGLLLYIEKQEGAKIWWFGERRRIKRRLHESSSSQDTIRHHHHFTSLPSPSVNFFSRLFFSLCDHDYHPWWWWWYRQHNLGVQMSSSSLSLLHAFFALLPKQQEEETEKKRSNPTSFDDPFLSFFLTQLFFPLASLSSSFFHRKMCGQ